KVDNAYYGDGSMRLLSPVSPSLHVGAESVLAVGIRRPKDPQVLSELNRQPSDEISFADIAGVFLNAVFLDTLESDLERLRRVNQTLREVSEEARQALKHNFRMVPVESQQPS